jgi:hypothetical protein
VHRSFRKPKDQVETDSDAAEEAAEPRNAVEPVTAAAAARVVFTVPKEVSTPRPVIEKSNRQKITTLIDPKVYDAVRTQLICQKRAGKRSSTCFTDLLDELLRTWLDAKKRTAAGGASESG